ncbi:hypothetical protein C8Q78DRAFT_469204 [Trametes maxima]|nr:hypothetical protein C8Q78DRAFT_469204 [Trametes maxima]
MDVRPSSFFPTEICEEIIKHVDAGRLLFNADNPDYRAQLATLSACALTCRAWLPTSRVCLYHNISFSKTDVRSLERLVWSLNANPMLRDLVVNLQILDNGGPVNLASSTREVDSSQPRPADQPRLRSPRVPSHVPQLWWPMLAGKLPRLQALTLFFDSGLSLPHPRSAAWLRTFSTVTKLSLAWRASGTYADLFRILSAFSRLRSLFLVGLGWIAQGAPRIDEVPRRAKPPSVSALTVLLGNNDDRSSMRAVFHGLLFSVASTIETLHVAELVIPPYESSPSMEEHSYTGSRTSNLRTLANQCIRFPRAPVLRTPRRLAVSVQRIRPGAPHLLLPHRGKYRTPR